MNTKIKRIVVSAMFASLVCVATMIIKIQTFNGYVNMGDCMVLLCGYMLPGSYAFFAAGIGSGLADMFAGYMSYVPATFLIKALMAFVLCIAKKRFKSFGILSVFAVVSELVMVAGYYVFEGFLYGFVPSLVNVFPNVMQGVFGVIVFIILVKIFDKYKITVEG